MWSPAFANTHLGPYIVIGILSAVVPMLKFTSLGLFCNYQFALLNPFTILPRLPALLSPTNCQSVLCVYVSVSILVGCISLQINVFKLLWGRDPEAGLLGHMVTILNFLRILNTIFHRGYINFHSHQQWTASWLFFTSSPACYPLSC